MAQEDQHSRFREFDARLEELRARRGLRSGRRRQGRGGRALSQGMQAAIDVLVGLVGGLAIGYGMDVWLGTRPLFLILFFVLGSAAGLRNAIRDLREAGRADGMASPDGAGGRDEGEDGG